MVSLNEKRSKIRYVVQNKTEWVDDGNKFGKKMLEKMGWTSGAGLGKNEDGRTEHIDLKYKSNLKGVGYVNGKYDTTWISHSQSFDSVLQQLQQTHPSSPSSSLQNFKQNIQQTKTRFNYKKQSSGKDLSSRTNDELDCIFGWNKTIDEPKQESDEEKETEAISDNLYITSKKSIHDYFKEKTYKKAQRQCQDLSTLDNDSTDETISSCEQVPSNNPINEEVELTTSKKRKKKKEESIIDEDEKIKKQKTTDDDDELNQQSDSFYSGSNLSNLNGYKGWNIDSSFNDIIKKKEKQKKRYHKISS